VRDLLWLIVVAALAVAWYVDRQDPPAVVPAPLPASGRYLVHPLDNSGDRLLLVDTQTGTCWERNSVGVWSIKTNKAPNFGKD
jgi:hypothetical protein